jgi:hypothetical protein
MSQAKSSRAIPGFVALSIALSLLLVPASADASKALFRVKRSFFGVFSPVYNTPEPPTMGGGKAPAASLYVFNTASKFVLPKSFISYMTQYYCPPGQCFPGYPISGGYYSYFNGQGRFGAGPSKGAPGPTTTTTLVFPTTMGNNLPFGGTKANKGTGNPATPTTAFSGRYDFLRGGSIQVTPGPNRFSGTMRLIYGPNASFYQYITVNTPFKSRAYGSFKAPTTLDETEPGETTSSGAVKRYRMTPLLQNKACITSPPGTPNTRPPCGTGNYISAQAHYLHLLAPWTTGMIEGYQPLGTYLTAQTFTGYDDMSPAMTANNKIYVNKIVGSAYPSRIVSLVRPRLVHTYLRDGETGDIITNFQAMRTWRMDVLFLPEPGAVAMLVTGVAGLAGLAALTRRRRR